MPFHLIEWVDALFNAEAHYTLAQAKEEANLCTLITVGFLLDENPARVVLAMEESSEGLYRHLVMIPPGAIVKRAMLMKVEDSGPRLQVGDSMEEAMFDRRASPEMRVEDSGPRRRSEDSGLQSETPSRRQHGGSDVR